MVTPWKLVLVCLTLLATTCQAATSRQIDLVAAVLAAEARSEGPSGMAAVAQVVRNRGGDPASTVTRRRQFSCLNVSTLVALVARMRPQAGWTDARRLAITLYMPGNRAICKIVGRATHYHDTSIRRPNGWGPCLARVGKLKFYKPK